MTETAFARALAFTLPYEGGLVDHPRDPGGRTNRGITQRKLDEFRAARPRLNFPARVDDLTLEQTATLYRLEYWQRLSCDELEPRIAMIVFDAGVNCGIGRAARWLQQAVGARPDGIIGAQTIAASKRRPLDEIAIEFNARRAHHFMLQDSIDDDFGLGWGRRLLSLHTAALAA